VKIDFRAVPGSLRCVTQKLMPLLSFRQPFFTFAERHFSASHSSCCKVTRFIAGRMPIDRRRCRELLFSLQGNVVAGAALPASQAGGCADGPVTVEMMDV
jgi:hypothetical protein